MSLSELASFAVSGSAATALSALITDRVPVSGANGAAAKAATTTTRPATAVANGFVFFFAYYVAATAGLRLGGRHDHDSNSAASSSSTRRAATQAFFVGATAAICTRLLGPGDSVPRGEVHGDARPPNEEDGAEASAPAPAPEPAPPPQHRWSLSALEDAVVLALDPGLTFCLHEILAQLVAQRQWRRRHATGQQHRQQQQRSPGGSVFGAAATTFLLAAASKAAATGITYPLYTAVTAAAAERRRRQRDGKSKEEDGGGGGGSVLAALWSMIRQAGGVRTLYADWLRTVATASLGHGLTMAFQRAMYGLVLRLVYAVTGALRARLPSFRERMPPATTTQQEQWKRSREDENDVAARSLSQQPPAELADMVVDERQQVTKAVETWLESTTGGSDDVARPSDHARNTSMLPAPPSPPSRSPLSSSPLKTVVSSQQRQQQQWLESRPPRQDAPVSSDPEAAAIVRYEATRRTESAISSRNREAPFETSERSAQQPRRLQPWPQAGDEPGPASRSAPTDNDVDIDADGDDGDGSVIFNMISKSPRVLKR